MVVKIREVKRCRDNAFGYFRTYGVKKATISISLAKNKDVAEYASTALHELLHLWGTLLRLKGFRTSDITEHRFINAVEHVVIEMCTRYLKKRKGAKK